jgi:hypothetical protein
MIGKLRKSRRSITSSFADPVSHTDNKPPAALSSRGLLLVQALVLTLDSHQTGTLPPRVKRRRGPLINVRTEHPSATQITHRLLLHRSVNQLNDQGPSRVVSPNRNLHVFRKLNWRRFQLVSYFPCIVSRSPLVGTPGASFCLGLAGTREALDLCHAYGTPTVFFGADQAVTHRILTIPERSYGNDAFWRSDRRGFFASNSP